MLPFVEGVIAAVWALLNLFALGDMHALVARSHLQSPAFLAFSPACATIVRSSCGRRPPARSDHRSPGCSTPDAGCWLPRNFRSPAVIGTVGSARCGDGAATLGPIDRRLRIGTSPSEIEHESSGTPQGHRSERASLPLARTFFTRVEKGDGISDGAVRVIPACASGGRAESTVLRCESAFETRRDNSGGGCSTGAIFGSRWTRRSTR